MKTDSATRLLEKISRQASQLVKSTKDFVDEHNTVQNREKVANFAIDTSSQAYEKIKDLGSSATEYAANLYTHKSEETISENNWYGRLGAALEEVCDAIYKKESGWSRSIVTGLGGKLAGAGASVGIFSIASLIGTASTGTAIGSLSGAAFTSSALAWVGGSVLMGSIIVGAAGIATGVAGVIATKRIFTKFFKGTQRGDLDLHPKERAIVDSCMALALAFREQSKSGRALEPVVAHAMHDEALDPLCDKLREYKFEVESWPLVDRSRIEKAILKIERLTVFAGNFSKKYPDFTIGIVTAVILKLMANEIPEFNDHELLVIDALRRSNNSLTEASHEELASYLKDKDPEQLQGLHNNIKGIYHELRYAQAENSDNDEYRVELFDETNHPGSDAVLINTETGETSEIQLKATNYISYIEEHNNRYANVEVFATDEVAEISDEIHSSGITNAELNSDVDDVFSSLRSGDDGLVGESMAVASLMALARAVRVNLRNDKQLSKLEREDLLRGGISSAATAGLVSLMIG